MPQVRNRNRSAFGFSLPRRSSIPIVRYKSHCMKAKAVIHFLPVASMQRAYSAKAVVPVPELSRQKMETGLEFHAGPPGVS